MLLNSFHIFSKLIILLNIYIFSLSWRMNICPNNTFSDSLKKIMVFFCHITIFTEYISCTSHSWICRLCPGVYVSFLAFVLSLNTAGRHSHLQFGFHFTHFSISEDRYGTKLYCLVKPLDLVKPLNPVIMFFFICASTPDYIIIFSVKEKSKSHSATIMWIMPCVWIMWIYFVLGNDFAQINVHTAI